MWVPRGAGILCGHEEVISQPASARTHHKYVDEAEISPCHLPGDETVVGEGKVPSDNRKLVLEPGLQSHSLFYPLVHLHANTLGKLRASYFLFQSLSFPSSKVGLRGSTLQTC